jgi:hypothetical protein
MVCLACGGAEVGETNRMGSLAQLLRLTEPQNRYGSPTQNATTQDKPFGNKRGRSNSEL